MSDRLWLCVRRRQGQTILHILLDGATYRQGPNPHYVHNWNPKFTKELFSILIKRGASWTVKDAGGEATPWTADQPLIDRASISRSVVAFLYC
jgi:hypothetical protein